jgi:hypothetical protein
MKPLILFLNCFILFPAISFSQQVLEVKYETDSKGNYKFSCQNHGYCNYIVEVNFFDLQNVRADVKLPYMGTVQPGQNSLFTLTKDNASQAPNFRYSYRYVKGCVKPKINMGFTYLLPVAAGEEVQSREMEYFLKRFANDPEPPDWYALAISMKPGDTIYASRGGTVTEAKDDAYLKQSGYELASTDNYIEVYHDDCSFARYQVFRDKSIFVKPGDHVVAGEPIGIVGGEKYVSGPHLRFCVYYTIDKDPFTDYEKTGRSSRFAYVPVQFWTKDTGKQKLVNNSKYVSEHPTELITQEMSKRELKKWMEKHKS